MPMVVCRLVADVVYRTPQREQFGLYKQYGEDNEHSQRLLYELEEKQSIKAFFVVSKLPTIAIAPVSVLQH